MGVLVLLALGIWTYTLVRMTTNKHRRLWLADLPATEPTGGWPTVAMIFAARNEATTVERAVPSMARLDYPRYRLIAVNDRSTDRTGPLLHELAKTHPNLEVVDITSLPSGWLGKNHALHAAAGSTDAQWLLFTDADIHYSPDALRRALAFAVTHDYDHVTMYPEMVYGGGGEKLFVCLFFLLFGFRHPSWAVENPRSKGHVGIGAFNLVRREALETIEGFKHLALSVDDDVRLGEALKAHGFRTKALYGTGTVSVQWQTSVSGYVTGLEKNAFAGLDFSLPHMAWVMFGTFTLGAAPHLGLLFGGPWVRVAAALALGAMFGIMMQARRSSGVSPFYALATPISTALLMTAMIRSTYLTMRRQGIVWRKHHYPLAELRAHVRERRAWVRAAWREKPAARKAS